MRLTINFHHDGTFVPSPLMYQGDESTIHDIEFEGMPVVRLSKLLQGTCMFPVKCIFFLIPVKELSNGLIKIKNDLDLANCIAIGYKNGKVIDMFLEHHGYDLSHCIKTHIDNNDDELSDVKMEDITGFGASDFVGKDDVVIPNRRNNYRSLFVLCGRGLAEGRSGGKKRSPSKKGVQGKSFADKGKAKDVQGESGAKKGKRKAMGKDGNNQMFPIAWVVVNVKNNDNWEWFLACLYEDLRLNSGVYMTVILDGHKPKPTVKKRTSGRKKSGSNFVFPTNGKDGGDVNPTSAGPSAADPTSADPIVADPTVQTSVLQIQLDESVTDDPIDDIPTQQSKTSDTAKKIKDAIATGRLKTARLKRRRKSERIAKKGKPYQFAKDGVGSCLDKAWDVDDVLAKE
nr:60S ribosomal protein L34 [Tanacetum cinerariifolium]